MVVVVVDRCFDSDKHCTRLRDTDGCLLVEKFDIALALSDQFRN